MTKNKGGLKKGQTNNPNGRPVGSKNLVTVALRERIVGFLVEDFESLIEDIRKLPHRDKVKAAIDLLKLVVPRPISDEEKDNAQKFYNGLECLFGQPKEEDK